MSSLLNFPYYWSTSSKQQKDNAAVVDKDTAAILASLVGNDDAELAELLAQVAASGKPVTEDVVVDCQLTQFPVYGSSSAGNNASLYPKQNQSNSNDAKASLEENSHHSTAENWLAWVGATNTSNSSKMNSSSAHPSSQHPDDDEDDLFEPPLSPVSESTTTRRQLPQHQQLPQEDWDAEEQFLWKTKNTNTIRVEETKQQDFQQQDQRRRATTARIIDTRLPLIVVSAARADVTTREESSMTEETKRDTETGLTVVPSQQHANSSTYVRTSPRSGSQQKAATTLSQQQKQQQYDTNNTVVLTENRQHWMPDQLCKQCYACEAPFTVFRRRHHCRLCGLVFCNICSAHFVPVGGSASAAKTTKSTAVSTPSGASPATLEKKNKQTSGNNNNITVRVCQMCFDQYSSRGVVMAPAAAATRSLFFGTPAIQNDEDDGGQQQEALESSRSNNNMLPSPPLARSKQAPSPLLQEQIRLLAADAAAAGNDSSILHQMCQATRHSMNSPIPPSMAQDADDESSSQLYSDSQADDTGTVGSDIRDARKKVQTGTSRMAATKSRHVPTMMMNSTSYSRTSSSIQEGNRHLGSTAAEHLELMARDLLRLHAPLLWDAPFPDSLRRTEQERAVLKKRTITSWINKLLTLATKCCATVDPNVKKGDLLDIRPYVKVKVIPGGSYRDCAYMSGILFRKTVSHKRMAKEVDNPRIMLLSGGIEFTRTENRIASLETLFEQEEKYMQILVNKILSVKPDVLMVGRSVSRKAQELLLEAGVVLVQHVKTTLLNRISRQTGATVISSTDHVMNQFGENVLGKCRRFRLVAFRDNEVWTDRAPSAADDASITSKNEKMVPKKRSIEALLADPNLSNHERQAALAANRLGEEVLDGSEAVMAGLAKRGVAHTYIMLEGCAKHLGCSVVLRGADRATLKQVKTVFQFLASVAYNLRLETSYLRERGARLRPDFKVLPVHRFSSSLCVDYGNPPGGRKVRPWNGGNNETVFRRQTGELSAFDHQAILITSVWMTDKSQCCPAEVKGICYYSLQDVALGQFLRDSCFNLSLKCQNPNCKKSVLDHSLSFVHNDGLINIMVEELDEPLPPSPHEQPRDDPDEAASDDEEDDADRPIATWTYCNHCRKVVTPLVYISEKTWKFSFGKFLEVFFYNRDAILNAADRGCSCNLQSTATLYFGCGKLAARFAYEPVSPFGVFVRRTLPSDVFFHRKEAMRNLELISVASSSLFVNFDKHIEKVSREARSLFNSAMNRPEHLQTVLSELNKIGSEVDNAAKTLQEKIASVSDSFRRSDDGGTMNSALYRFPLTARRYLFILTTAWNEKLSATGQAITAMRKIAISASHRSDGGIGQNVAANGDPLYEELAEGMKRLRQLVDHYARYNVTDITQVLPWLPGGSDFHQDGDYDEDFDDPETSIDFSEGVDADVLASRRRLKNSDLGSAPSSGQSMEQRPTKSLGTRRSLAEEAPPNHDSTLSGAPPKPTPGGAVKSAITRFFNRGGRDYDQYVVNLGVFAEGRPRLPPGVDGIVVPVYDEQLSTIIAYSLASVEYAKQFKRLSKAEGNNLSSDDSGTTDQNRKSDISKPDLDAGVGSDDAFRHRTNNDSREQQGPASPVRNAMPSGGSDTVTERRETERRMLHRNKSHIKHTFRDVDEKGQVTCKFVCTTYWATQFHEVRQSFLCRKTDGAEANAQSSEDIEQSFVESLSSAYSWAASGGKSGASFARTADDRFVIKCISRTELQMFLDCAPAYFEYLSKAFFHGLPTVLCKIVGVFQIGVHNRETGKRSMEQVAVMQNIFYNRKITKIFDLKGSLRGRFAAQKDNSNPDTPTNADSDRPSGYQKHARDRRMDESSSRRSSMSSSIVDETTDTASKSSKGNSESGPSTLLDGDFLEFTLGRPMPLTDRAKAVFQMSILNDSLFLSIINVLDYSILVGVDEENNELVVGIIDFMRQYDILKQMERVGKSLPMVVGSEAPTIIQPPLYKARFTNAMERYFMTVPSKWTSI